MTTDFTHRQILGKSVHRYGISASYGLDEAGVREAIDLGTPLPVITAALMSRFASQGRDDYAARFLSQLRHAFGGHFVQKDGG